VDELIRARQSGRTDNEHLLLDFGAMSLGSGVVLGAAALFMERRLVQTALISYLVFAVAHLAIHAHYAGQLRTSTAAILMAALALAALVPVALLVLTNRPRATKSWRAPG